MIELTLNEFEQCRPLFQEIEYSLSIQAAIEGNNPGRIFVDNKIQPSTALALTVEGYHLAGVHNNPTTNTALRRLLKERIFTGQIFVNGDWSMSLSIYPQTWESKLPDLVPTHEIEKLDRYHYLCHAVQFDWRSHIPAGYSVRRVDRALPEAPALTEALRGWIDIDEIWGTVDNFLDKAVSICILHGDQIVSWCTPDCVAGDRIDVGIITDPAHRRRGLATIAVAATVEQCLDQGFSAVGWHCNAGNIPSWKTAEKVGFQRHCHYTYYYYIYDPIDHLAELGWYHFKLGHYAKTTAYYDQVFAQRDDNPDYYYHLAAVAWAELGNSTQALNYLHAAVDHGWTSAAYTKQVAAFEPLHGTRGWNAVLARMS
ncbi:MAG: GNAT family N-acetyltransferase [Chloroflexi bacterium]|jgi:RimJ/RimL family protein N-acetyltransferase|nr:GNAT family N-acetyltransferase [Chloroflexota bacterium]